MSNSGRDRQRETLALSITQAEAETGISYDTIRRAIVAGELPSFRPGRGRQGKIMIRRKALEQWLEQMELRGA